MDLSNVVAMNNIYLYPDTKYAGDTNEFFTEPHCANTAVCILIYHHHHHHLGLLVTCRESMIRTDGAKSIATIHV